MRKRVEVSQDWLVHGNAGRIAGGYVALAIVWTLGSNWLVSTLVGAPLSWWGQSLKSALFLLVTGALLYGALTYLQSRNRRALVLLAESEEAYRRMFADNPNPMFVFDVETLRFLAVNDAAVAHYGWDRDEFLAMTLWDIRPPSTRPELETFLASKVKERNVRLTVHHWTRDGRTIIVEINSHALEFGGRPARLVLALDVTQRVRAEGELYESRLQLEEAQRIASIGSWTNDLDRGEIRWSPALLALLQTDETLTYEKFMSWVVREDRAALLAVGEQLERTGRFKAEYRLRRGDGAIRHVVSQGERVGGEGRGRLFGTLQDVTERKLAEQALADSERKYRQLVELMPDGLLIHDGQEVVFANAAMARLLGAADPAALTGRPIRLILAGFRPELLMPERSLPDNPLLGLAAGPGLDNVFQPSLLRRLDGEPVEVEVAVQRIRLGQRDCVQGVVRDLRAQNRMQAALARANERLSRLSTQIIETGEQERRHIARELHDEVGQLLTFTQMTAAWLQRHVADDEQRGRADALAGALSEALAKVRDLALLLRPRQLDAAGLGAAIEAHLARYMAGMGIGWEVVAEPLEPRPDATVEIALFRIFQEAVTNAIKHSGASRLEVRLQCGGDRLRLTVRDDGQGFDRDRALQGTASLGLLSMAERANLVGGELTIDSGPEGTEIRAVVPYRVTLLPARAQQEKISG